VFTVLSTKANSNILLKSDYIKLLKWKFQKTNSSAILQTDSMHSTVQQNCSDTKFHITWSLVGLFLNDIIQ